MTTQKPPRSKSVARAAKTALRTDDAARKKSLDSFQNLPQNFGVGANNPMSTATYGFNPITRNRTLLEWAYRGSWMAGAVIDSVADDMTREGIEFKGDVDAEDQEQLTQAGTSMGIWNAINDGVRWSRLYGGAIVVMLIDGQDPATPLRLQSIRKGQFRGLITLDRWMVEPSLNDLVTEMGPHLGLPKFYSVTAQAPALSMMRIHYSRVIRLEGIRLPYWQRIMENMWGISVLERMYDRMVAFDSATTGAAQLVYKAYIRTYKVENMRELVAAGGDAYAGFIKYIEMMRSLQGVEGMTVMDSKDEFEGVSHTAFSGLADILGSFSEQVSAAAEIPLVRLFGQSPKGFNTGETDVRNYYDRVHQKQIRDLHVGVNMIYHVMALSEGVSLHKSVSIKFKPLWQMSAKEKAEIASSITSAVTSAEGVGLVDKPTALRELKRSAEETGVWGAITDKLITEAENEPPPLPEDGVPEDGVPGAPGAAAAGATGTTKVAPVQGKAAGPSKPASADPGAAGSE